MLWSALQATQFHDVAKDLRQMVNEGPNENEKVEEPGTQDKELEG